MKRFLLVMAFLLFVCKPVYAEKVELFTVKETYFFDKTDINVDNVFKHGVLTGYYKGIRDFNYYRYSVIDEARATCIGRPLQVWFDLVYDRYKHNKINGDDYFYDHFIKIIEEVCEVKL